MTQSGIHAHSVRPRFTVFTPTYNRAKTLPRVFESLSTQSFKDFEWLVIDDGSADNTRNLISTLSEKATFPVRYLYQVNGGKHRAHNAALEHLRGLYTLVLDSDDELTPKALQILSDQWQLAERERGGEVAAILGRSILGGEKSTSHAPGPTNANDPSFVEGHHFSLALSGKMEGDHLPCYRSDILRRYPFPTRVGDNSYVLEGVVWIPIGEDFLVRCISSVVRIYHRDSGDPISLMRISQNVRRIAWGRLQYTLVTMTIFEKYFKAHPVTLIKHAANLTRFSLHDGHFARKADLPRGALARIICSLLAPIGAAIWLLDHIQEWNEKWSSALLQRRR